MFPLSSRWFLSQRGMTTVGTVHYQQEELWVLRLSAEPFDRGLEMEQQVLSQKCQGMDRCVPAWRCWFEVRMLSRQSSGE